jgi:hypothetical protein
MGKYAGLSWLARSWCFSLNDDRDGSKVLAMTKLAIKLNDRSIIWSLDKHVNCLKETKIELNTELKIEGEG